MKRSASRLPISGTNTVNAEASVDPLNVQLYLLGSEIGQYNATFLNFKPVEKLSWNGFEQSSSVRLPRMRSSSPFLWATRPTRSQSAAATRVMGSVTADTRWIGVAWVVAGPDVSAGEAARPPDKWRGSGGRVVREMMVFTSWPIRRVHRGRRMPGTI